MTGPFARPVQILHVEDSDADVLLTQEAFRDAGVVNRIHAVGDGEEALAYLRNEGPHADAPRPDLVLLDLNLPRKDGREVLAEMKSDDDLASIPVIVVSSSAADEDLRTAYESCANAYVRKPIDIERFVEFARSIESFWLRVAELPPNQG